MKEFVRTEKERESGRGKNEFLLEFRICSCGVSGPSKWANNICHCCQARGLRLPGNPKLNYPGFSVGLETSSLFRKQKGHWDEGRDGLPGSWKANSEPMNEGRGLPLWERLWEMVVMSLWMHFWMFLLLTSLCPHPCPETPLHCALPVSFGLHYWEPTNATKKNEIS